MRVYEAKMVYSFVSLGDEIQLNTPTKIADYLRSAFEENPLQEAFYCVYLDRKNHPLARHLITLGTVDSTVVAPREVFRGAILESTSGLVVSHNHPSGDRAPGAADIRVTRTLREAAKILQIELLDHVIAGDAKSDPQGRGFFPSWKRATCEVRSSLPAHAGSFSGFLRISISRSSDEEC